MSLVPPGTAPSFDINLYASVQVAVTSAALYDHVLALGREVELIWLKPTSLVTVLYVIERYLGDIVLVAGLCLCFSISTSEAEYVNVFEIIISDLHDILCRIGIRLFQFRAWGALAYSWATQATMQLRIYAMYRQSRRILALLVMSFLCEIAAIAFIIFREIGPKSTLKAINDFVPGEDFCTFSGINGDFVYIFIPFLCFEFFLFILAARVFVSNMRRNRESSDEKRLRLNTFVGTLTRDSLCYFFVNLIACAVVMGLWQSVTLYANICIPFVMLLEVLVGTRLILDFRERYARSDGDPVVSGRCSSLHFRGDGEIPMDSVHISVRCHIETVVVTDAGT